MHLAIETILAEADEAYKLGMKSSFIAEQARADYERLCRENRERFARKGRDATAADAAFSTYQVAKDCIETDQMHSRWSTERLIRARSGYQQVTRLQDALSQFIRERAPRVPRPRPRSDT